MNTCIHVSYVYFGAECIQVNTYSPSRVSAVVAQEGEVAGGAEAESIELGGDGGKGVDKVEIVAEWGG